MSENLVTSGPSFQLYFKVFCFILKSKEEKKKKQNNPHPPKINKQKKTFSCLQNKTNSSC